MPFVDRLIHDTVLGAVGAPVIILEGARAVGKTTLMRTSAIPAGYSYTSLAEPDTLAFARADPAGWLRRLVIPAVIDEAQLLPELPLLLKEYVDTLGSGTHFILTGSATIGRAGLGGADPLARRSRRVSMSPLTRWEIASQSGSLVDLLFDADVRGGTRLQSSDEELERQLVSGGFPTYVFPDTIQTRQQAFGRIRSDVAALLSDEVLSARGVDATIARTVLDSLLRTPGAIFNASRIAQSHDLDRRTVDRYLSVFERVFLLHWLPNLATSPGRQSHSRSKIHPTDTSLSAESLARAGVDLLSEREKFGELLESHVVNQILASSEWSETRPEAGFWRQASSTSPEVDLVLLDGRDRVVGIEVKATHSVHPRDIKNFVALRKERGLHRGFLFYTGSEVRQLDDDVWALPMSVLSDSSTFEPPESAATKRTTNGRSPITPITEAPKDASMFLSYVRADDERSNGRIVKFARDLVDTYDFLFGRVIELFVDRDDIVWGEQWARRLRVEAETTTFLLSIVTPRYLRSQACRTEVVTFAAAADEAQEPRLLLPLQWVDISGTDVVADTDPVLSKIRETQWEDVSEIRRIEPDSLAYEQLLERVANRLKQTIDGRASRPAAVLGPVATENDDRDVIELTRTLDEENHLLESALANFKSAFDGIDTVLSAHPTLRPSQTYGAARAMAELSAELVTPVEELKTATTELGDIWRRYDSGISRVLMILNRGADEAMRRRVFETLDGVVHALEVPGSEDMYVRLRSLGDISRHLQPMSNAMSSAVQLLRGIQTSARVWRDRLV